MRFAWQAQAGRRADDASLYARRAPRPSSLPLPHLQALLQARCVRKLLPPGLQPPQEKRMQERERPSKAQRGTAPRHGPASIVSQHRCADLRPPWSRPSVAHLRQWQRGGQAGWNEHRQRASQLGASAAASAAGVWRRKLAPAGAASGKRRSRAAAPALCSLRMRHEEQQGRDEQG